MLAWYTANMSYITLDVEIVNGRVVLKEPDKLPVKGKGLLTVLTSADPTETQLEPSRGRVKTPLIRCKPGTVINPSSVELDASLWD